jgi:hypothetical protein
MAVAITAAPEAGGTAAQMRRPAAGTEASGDRLEVVLTS